MPCHLPLHILTSHIYDMLTDKERDKNKGVKRVKEHSGNMFVCVDLCLCCTISAVNMKTHRQIISCKHGAAVVSQTQVLTHNETQNGVFLR